MSRFSRRDFLKTATVGAGVLATGVPAAKAATQSATDWVTLGNSGVKVTRLAFGTGTFGGRVQRELGQKEFTRIVRHAYDRGIRFFETADAYDQMHEMLAEALRGVPRDSYRLMTKFRWRDADDPTGTIDRFRRELNTDYFDILLLHNVRTPTWPEQLKPLRDALSEAKEKKVILCKGASCHGLQPLAKFPGNNWLDVALMRMNHTGARMDNAEGDNGFGEHDAAIQQIRRVKPQGTGVIGMKLVGEGQFTKPEDRQAAVNYVFSNKLADTVTMGYKSTAEIDEAIERVTRALNAA